MTGPDTRFAAVAVSGTPVQSWCDTCRAYSLVVTPLYFLTGLGVTQARPVAMCEIHQDPELADDRR